MTKDERESRLVDFELLGGRELSAYLLWPGSHIADAVANTNTNADTVANTNANSYRAIGGKTAVWRHTYPGP